MELTDSTAREGLARKYRELCEKHERLLHRLEEQAKERSVVSRLSRATLRSRLSAVALIEGGVVVGANPAWRRLDTPSREWTGTGSPARTFASLAAAALASADSRTSPGSNLFVRVADGVRVRLRIEWLDADGTSPASILVIAIEDDETGSREHRVRNHLAAVAFQAHLLRNESEAGSEALRRADAITELVRLASEALESHPQPTR
jgi:hypothetical protein